MARTEVPQRADALAALPRVDYADAFAVPVTAHRTPSAWIDTAQVQMPALFAGVRLAHRVLGLRLVPSSPEHPLGWGVLHRTDDEVVLGNEGLLGTVRIVGLSAADRLVVATLIRYGPAGRPLWAVAAPLHRAVAGWALDRLSRSDAR